MEIRLLHVCQRKLALAGRPAGLALAAMWYLGKTEVTPALVEKIRRKLGSSEFEVLLDAPGNDIGNSVLIEFGGRNITEPNQEHVVRPDIAEHVA